MDISVIIPAFNEEESIEELYYITSKVITKMNKTFEIIFIDDGSKDKTWDKIHKLCIKEKECKGIKFKKNFGKSAALNTGFKTSKGKIVFTLDADLQDDPNEIPKIYNLIVEKKLDLVSGWKKKRNDPIGKTIPSKFFNFVTRVVSGIKIHDFNCGLKAYKKELVKDINIYGEFHRFIPLLAKYQGYYKISEKEVKHFPRKYGVSKFGIERMLYGFLDLLSVILVFKFRRRPMHFFGTIGILFFIIGGLTSLWIIFTKLLIIYTGTSTPRDVVDQPLFFLSLTSIIIGVQLFLTGFICEILFNFSGNKLDYTIEKEV